MILLTLPTECCQGWVTSPAYSGCFYNWNLLVCRWLGLASFKEFIQLQHWYPILFHALLVLFSTIQSSIHPSIHPCWHFSSFPSGAVKELLRRSFCKYSRVVLCETSAFQEKGRGLFFTPPPSTCDCKRRHSTCVTLWWSLHCSKSLLLPPEICGVSPLVYHSKALNQRLFDKFVFNPWGRKLTW